MTLCTCNFFSKALKSNVDVTVYIPSFDSGMTIMSSYEDVYGGDKRFRTVYLLHGMLGDHTAWIRGSVVERYAEAAGLALVMPSGQNSMYVDAVNGLPYFEFVSRELPLWAESVFPLRTDRDGRFIAGLSMGAYGALRHGLARPERYAAIGAFSGVTFLAETLQYMEQDGFDFPDFAALVGGLEAIPGTDNDLVALSKRCASVGQPLPHVYMACGTDDPLLEQNQVYAGHLKDLGFDVVFEQFRGAHEWPVWDRSVEAFMGFVQSGL